MPSSKAHTLGHWYCLCELWADILSEASEQQNSLSGLHWAVMISSKHPAETIMLFVIIIRVRRHIEVAIKIEFSQKTRVIRRTSRPLECCIPLDLYPHTHWILNPWPKYGFLCTAPLIPQAVWQFVSSTPGRLGLLYTHLLLCDALGPRG